MLKVLEMQVYSIKEQWFFGLLNETHFIIEGIIWSANDEQLGSG